jgi:hypothetical protein
VLVSRVEKRLKIPTWQSKRNIDFAFQTIGSLPVYQNKKNGPGVIELHRLYLLDVYAIPIPAIPNFRSFNFYESGDSYEDN